MQVKIMLYYICSTYILCTSVSLIDADYVNVIHLNTLHSKWKQSDSYIYNMLNVPKCSLLKKFLKKEKNCASLLPFMVVDYHGILPSCLFFSKNLG